jgi:hypothetical protein
MIDLYTKGTLTVIAVCLVGILLRGAIESAKAAGPIMKVTICAPSGNECLPLYVDSFTQQTGIRTFTR